MRVMLVLLAAMALAQCASGQDRRFRVNQSSDALVIIGVAETASNRAPVYSMLWRRLGPTGAFTEYDDARALAVRTNSGDSIRVRGIPGEFEIVRLEPGTYALDSVFATLRENRLSYIAQGVVEGPERPAFDVRAGEAIYLGIWEMDIQGANAATQLWRLDASDLRAVSRAARNRIVGEAQVRETHIRSAPCSPQRMNNLSQRQIC